MTNNTNLHKAKSEKNDEFYTQMSDIEKEIMHYKPHFEGKTVYCNCDDPSWSNFFLYFQRNFHHLGLKKLISTHYVAEGSSYKLEIIGNGVKNGQSTIPEYVQTPLVGNGDFRSAECIELLKEADIVVTNPPFSLFREFIAQLEEYGKKYLVLENQNAMTHKEIFPLMMANRLWLGAKGIGDMWFQVPEDTEPRKVRYKEEDGKKWISMGNICWYTNLDHKARHEELTLFKKYNPVDYPTYDTYDAIEVSKVANIPVDYDGVMGVPVTFMGKYNPDQFEIVGTIGAGGVFNVGKATVNGEDKYKRILIRWKR